MANFYWCSKNSAREVLSHPRVYKINKDEGYSRVPRLPRTRYSAKGSAKAVEIWKRDCKAPSSGENHIWSCGRHTDLSVGVSIFLTKLSLLNPNFLDFLDFGVAAFIRTDRQTNIKYPIILRVTAIRIGNTFLSFGFGISHKIHKFVWLIKFQEYFTRNLTCCSSITQFITQQGEEYRQSTYYTL